MNKHLVWLGLILIPALVLAPLSRLYKNQHYISADEHTQKQLFISGLEQVNAFQSTNTGPYKIQEFSPNYCHGSILLLPVYRNAEGAHILKHFIDINQHPNIRQGIIFQQQLYSSLPQWQFTLFQLKSKLYNLLQLENKGLPALVYAELGQCNIAQYLVSKAEISFSK